MFLEATYFLEPDLEGYKQLLLFVGVGMPDVEADEAEDAVDDSVIKLEAAALRRRASIDALKLPVGNEDEVIGGTVDAEVVTFLAVFLNCLVLNSSDFSFSMRVLLRDRLFRLIIVPQLSRFVSVDDELALLVGADI